MNITSTHNIFDSCWDNHDAEFTVQGYHGWPTPFCRGTVAECRALMEQHPGLWFQCSAYMEYEDKYGTEWVSWILPDHMVTLPVMENPAEYLPQRERFPARMAWTRTGRHGSQKKRKNWDRRTLSDLEGD